jgi:crotonobetainyl-CoA:carnitine CoA-transferase CaiB-like acyl-CoA transferase
MLRQLRPPVRMSGTPTGVWRPAPRLGEHTEEVLNSLQ